jgi:hypothetical protein
LLLEGRNLGLLPGGGIRRGFAAVAACAFWMAAPDAATERRA